MMTECSAIPLRNIIARMIAIALQHEGRLLQIK